MTAIGARFLLLAAALMPVGCRVSNELRNAAIEASCREHLESTRASRDLSGISAAVVLPDGEVVAVAVGHDAAGAVLTPASKLMSGSIGKTYCAAVALQLVGEGRLALDGRVADVLGDRDWYARIPNAATITLRNLLDHSAGIREHVWHPEFQRAVVAAGDRAMSPVECLAFVLDERPLFAAGEGFAYADTNYLLAGLCVEKVTGEPFAKVLRARVL
ncbi:MAG: beta-lactamase family protein, partial [Planctomycetes bacterium]|nr:beta-lactamase family protein [Planctomycetota bacterium]